MEEIRELGPGKLSQLTSDLSGIVAQRHASGVRLGAKSREMAGGMSLLRAAGQEEKEAAAEEAAFRLPVIRRGGLARLDGKDVLESAVNAARCALTAVRGSSNLKGSHSKTIKEGITLLLAATQELASRLSDSSADDRVAKLKEELNLANSKVRQLMAEKEAWATPILEKTTKETGSDTVNLVASRDAITSPIVLRPEKTLLPPCTATTSTRQDEEFITVTRRRKQKKNKKNQGEAPPNSKPAPKPAPKKITIKPPRTAAVVLKNETGKKTFSEVLSAARNNINISEIGISSLRIRPSAAGGRVLEIRGENRAAKAAELAARIRDAVGSMGVTASCPERRVDLRIEGLCESATSSMVATELARVGGCSTSDISVRFPSGGGSRRYSSAYASVPAAVASVLLQAGAIVVGWVRAKLVLLPKRKTVCVRCLHPGHVGSRCPNVRERGDTALDRCFRCGEKGHRARECANKICCAPCSEAGRPAQHRLGGPSCGAPAVRGRPIRWGSDTRTTGGNVKGAASACQPGTNGSASSSL